MGKRKSTSAKSVQEIIEPVVAELTEKQQAAEAAKNESTEAEQQPATEAAPAPKKRKMVEFLCHQACLVYATEKAQLLSFLDNQGAEVKIWLAKSLLYTVADGDVPERMVCRIPAWLFFKKGLNNYFAITRWSSQAI